MGRFTLVLLAACWLAPSSAYAQLQDLREHTRSQDPLALSLGMEGALYVGTQQDADATLFAPSPAFSLRLWDFALEVAVPIAVVKTRSWLNGNERKARTGNLWAGLSYLPNRACGLTRISIGIGAPTARASTELEAQTLALARAVHGSWDDYLWTPDLLPLVVGYQTTLPLGQRQLGRLIGEGDLTVGLPGGGRETRVGMQWAGEASVGRAIRFGGRLGATYWPTAQGDPFQSALSVFLRYGGGDYWVGSRFVMNLDAPAGFAFAPEGVWGAQLSFIGTL